MGKEHWLATLYEREKRIFLLVAQAVVSDRHASEDIVHTAMLKMSKLDAPPQDSRLFAIQVVRNAAIDWLRQQQLRPRTNASDSFDSLRSNQPTSSRLEEESEEIEMGLNSLNRNYREVVELHLRAGLSFREITEITGVPLPTVASNYRRALLKIRNFLEVRNAK